MNSFSSASSRRLLPAFVSLFASGVLLAACSEEAGMPADGSGGSSSGGSKASSGGSSSGGSRSGSGGSAGALGSGGDGGVVGSGGEGGAPAVDVERDCDQGVTELKTAGLSSFVELCETSGPVRHLRIDGLLVGAPHGSSQLLFGFDEAPEGVRGFAIGEGRANILFYGGAPPHLTASAFAYAGEEESTLSDAAEFLLTSSTVCLDIHPGSSTRPPHFVLWRDGVNGADCSNLASLVLANSVAREVWWGGAEVGALNDTPPFFYQPGGPAKVTVSEIAALTEEDFLPFECASTVTAAASFVELCEIDGPVRHVKIAGLDIPVGSQTAQWVFGFEEAPEVSAPAIGENQFRLSLYGGHNMASQSTVTTNFAGTAGAAWNESVFAGTSALASATSACFEVLEGSEDESPAVIVWVGGVNGANCDDKSTLNRDSALGFLTEFGDKTGDFLRSSPIFFRKTSATNATITLSSQSLVEREDLESDIGAGGAGG